MKFMKLEAFLACQVIVDRLQVELDCLADVGKSFFAALTFADASG
jgi:hypothetical protein